MFLSRFIYIYLFSLPILIIGGCSNSLFISPQIPVGELNSQFPDESPAYSSDGKYLAFASDRNGNRDIYLLEIQQRRLIPLPNLNRRDSSQDQPALSADGRYIAYVSTERGRTDIMVYDRSSQQSVLLSANVRGSVSNPTISGDGRKIAFQTSQFGQWNIAIVERNIE
jgi:Tol biopolymer transport system component